MSLTKREFVFIDGENLVFRYQEMLKQGRTPREHVIHEPDTFVWSDHVIEHWVCDIMRVNYYTSAVGDPEKLRKHEERLLDRHYHFSSGSMVASGRLIPKIYKKEKKSHKSRRVDINITIDALWHAFRSDFEVCVILSGDGDFISLVESIQRLGKQVHVLAFSSGLDPAMKMKADNFQLLDYDFFEKE